MILRPSYLHNGISYTGKMSSLYWIRALWSKNALLHHWYLLAKNGRVSVYLFIFSVCFVSKLSIIVTFYRVDIFVNIYIYTHASLIDVILGMILISWDKENLMFLQGPLLLTENNQHRAWIINLHLHNTMAYDNSSMPCLQQQCSSLVKQTADELWHGWVITFLNKLWDVITYPCLILG